ncbi:MAG: nucleotidyltransferase family protein [Thermoplasmata archaeon]|nr:nucleotidyltransferase family protein [Thermoplasmata archaeon]
MMNLEEIKKIIEDAKEVIRRRYKAEVIGIFGSFARGEEGKESDIDILVEFKEGATLFDLSGLGIFLEEKLGRKVDIVSTRSIRKEIKENIMRDLVTV